MLSVNSMKVFEFIKKNKVLSIAVTAAILTCFIVPPDIEYISYFDFKTLTCLFCVLAVVCAFKNINFFYILAERTVRMFKTLRLVILALIYITFIGSMLIANDMALLTFLPLGYYVLKTTHNRRYMAFTFIMQNIAANLGGMLTPFGNPQNLYLYSHFNIPDSEFVGIMAIPFIISVVLITVCCLFVKNIPLEIKDEPVYLDVKKAVLYAVLFVLSIAIVFRGIPYYIGLLIIPTVLFFADKESLRMVDYPLLFTFVAFFVFSGNMSRISVIRELFGILLEKSTLVFSVLSCQIISNVPSAILLSQFTDNYRELLIGVNIGGVGTLIASLASLITFGEFKKHNPGRTKYYVKMFSAFNFGFLFVLTTAILVLDKIFM